MEYINRTEIQGRVGDIKSFPVNGKTLFKFALATDYAYRNANGISCIETTWHNISAWADDKTAPALCKLATGKAVHIIGRTRTATYVTVTGEDKRYTEIVASEVTVLED